MAYILPCLADQHDLREERIQQKLAHRQVVVGVQNFEDKKYVTARILINERPKKIWTILVNPYEFQGKICPRMKAVEVLSDAVNASRLRVTIQCPLFTKIVYVVDSTYDRFTRIKFHRSDGMIKDFRGLWSMTPSNNGHSTEMTYYMYIDPGMPVPQWMIREGLRMELPKTLIRLRRRVEAIAQDKEQPLTRNILAAASASQLSHAKTSITP
jgi:hypothetical protein